jgi:hypothetical protein
VIFDHDKFYDSADINLANVMIVKKVMKCLEMFVSTFVEVVIEEDENDVIEKTDQPISELHTGTRDDDVHSIKKRTSDDVNIGTKKEALLISESTSISEPESELSESRSRRGRRVDSSAENSVAMNTRSRKQAYAAALAIVSQLTSFHGAFVASLERPSMEKTRSHRDFLPEEHRYWKQMERHRFAREFQQAAIKELTELEKRGTYQLVKKSDDKPRIPLTWVFKYKYDIDEYLDKFKTLA